MQYQDILYESVRPGAARVAQPAERNATPRARTCSPSSTTRSRARRATTSVRVLIMAATGDHFSAGHDLFDGYEKRNDYTPEQHWVWERRALPRQRAAHLGLSEADHRAGARRVHRRRLHGGQHVRPDGGVRRRVLPRPGRAQPGRRRGRGARAPVGARPAQGQGVPVHRPAHQRGRGEAMGHGQPRRAARRARERDAAAGRAHRRRAADGDPHAEAIAQPHRRHAGLSQFDPGALRHAPAELVDAGVQGHRRARHGHSR